MSKTSALFMDELELRAEQLVGMGMDEEAAWEKAGFDLLTYGDEPSEPSMGRLDTSKGQSNV